MPLDTAMKNDPISKKKARKSARLGVDVGGTFTDVVLQLPNGTLMLGKVSSTPDDPGIAVQQGVSAILREANLNPDELGEIVHGTTVGSNTILQRLGAKTGLLTTRGFRDVLEIARIRTPTMFDLTWEKPEPLVARRYRREIEERVAADGSIVTPLNEASVIEQVEFLVSEGIEAIAICYLNSYANPEHEQRTRALIEARFPTLAITASCDVLQEMKEYERTSTTVVNAYLLTAMRVYLNRLIGALNDDGITAPLLVMSSAGGVMGASQAARKPVFVVGSGPAGGVVGAARLSRSSDIGSAIVFDMGGTTAKASIVENGLPSLTGEYEFRDGISTPSRFVKGGGYMLKVPSIDIAEVGAGGGSIAWIDEGGLMNIGPKSAGADPGPACYGLGNMQPTVTDANVALGLFNPDSLAGGSLKIDRSLSLKAIKKHIADPLSLSVEEAALGIRKVANIAMARALRAVSVERGRDPRDLTLVAFGGSGPAHAVDLARILGIRKVIMPTFPGVFCAVGMLASDVEHSFARPMRGLLQETDPAVFDRIVESLRKESMETLALEGFAPEDCSLRLAVDLRYVGQSSELTIPCPDAPFDAALSKTLVESFTETYFSTFGYSNDEPAETVTVRMTAAGRREAQLDFSKISTKTAGTKSEPMSRDAIFDASIGSIKTPILSRASVGTSWIYGPVIIESYDSTVVVPDQAKVCTDQHGSLLIEPKDINSWAVL
jgi:N-methylhydantoinase A